MDKRKLAEMKETGTYNDWELNEDPNAKKSKRASRKAKAKATPKAAAPLDGLDGGLPEPDQPEEAANAKAKAAPKRAAAKKAAAKKAAAKQKTQLGSKSPLQNFTPRMKPKRSPQPKTSLMERARQELALAAAKPETELEDIPTPKRKLFDDDAEAQPALPQPKPKAKRARKKQAEAEAQQPPSSEELVPQPKAKAKAKGKAKARARLSALTEDELSCEAAFGVISHSLRKIPVNESDLKDPILNEMKHSELNQISFSPYWTKAAVGVKCKSLPGGPQVAYFAFKEPSMGVPRIRAESDEEHEMNKRADWNRRTMCGFYSAKLFVTWYLHFSCTL